MNLEQAEPGPNPNSPLAVAENLIDRYLDEQANDLDDALARIEKYTQAGQAVSIGLCANAAEVLPELVKRGARPDMVTDQTSAHDMLGGYVPDHMSLQEAVALRSSDPEKYEKLSIEAAARQVEAMLGFQKAGSIVFDYGNNIRAQAQKGGVANAFDFPGFVPAYIRPLFCQGRGPFRWVALSGDPADIHRTDQAVLEMFPKDEALHRWIEKAQKQVAFQGLPARICWLGYGERHKLGLAFNELVRKGEVSAPIVIGRDHLDSGSVASPNRETEGMKDGTDAVSDWPLLNAMSCVSSGAHWVSLHHGGGVGMGYSQHSGMVVVADGTDNARARLERVLKTDPGLGVMRHADAGYEAAIECAKEFHLNLPGVFG